MDDFFELARSRDLLTPNGLRNIQKLRKADLLDFAIEASMALTSRGNDVGSGFDFSANDSLSGGSTSCVAIDCRVQRADDLARFAALYADHVVIRNPFAGYGSQNRVDYLRHEIAGDIAVMARLRPLIRKGFVRVAPPFAVTCAACSRHFKREQQRIFSSLERAGEELLSQFMPRISVERDECGCIEVRGPDALVQHGQRYFHPSKNSIFQGRLTRSRRESLVRERLIAPMIDDVYTHLLHSRHGGLNYLTDRELDLTVIRQLGGEEVSSIQRALVTGLSHAVPVVRNAPVQALLDLREKEGEAFAVYREAVASVLRDADLSSPATIKEAFAKKIRPELANIDMAVSSARKLFKRGLAQEIGVESAAISIGMMLGSVKPTLGAVLTALGGIGALRTVVQKVTDVATEPPVARENSFYFLWKVRDRVSDVTDRDPASGHAHGLRITAA
jgi:hypothetical protein